LHKWGDLIIFMPNLTNMKLFYFIISTCILTPLLALSQSNYREGYIIKNSGDTVRGYINYQEWNKSPHAVEFKSNADNSAQQYSPASIKGFGMWKFKSYISYVGPVTTGRLNTLMSLSTVLDTSVRQESTFLRVISRGPNVTLLYHDDDIKYRYFILENRNNAIAELKYYQYTDNSDKVVSKPVFISQLDQLSLKYTNKSIYANSSAPDNAYYEDVILRYVKLINNNVSIEENRESHFHFFVGLAFKYNNSFFNDGPAGFNYEKYSSSVSPMASIGVDISANPSVRNHVRIEAAVYTENARFNGTPAYFSLKRVPVAIIPQYIFNLSNNEKLKFFLSIGAGIVCYASSDNKVVVTQSGVVLTSQAIQNKGDSFKSYNQGDQINDPYSVGSLGLNAQLKLGLVVNKTIEIYATGIPFAVSGGSQYYYSNSGAAVGLSYLLGRK